VRTLYVVTHPEAKHHLDGLVGGWYDSELTDKGRFDAKRIARELRSRIPTSSQAALYGSDLTRTTQTAEAIGREIGLTATLLPGLREKSYGSAEGRSQSWLDERFIPPPPEGDRMNHFEGIPGSETKAEFVARIYAAMDRIVESPCENQIVVTHGYALTFVIAHWIAMPMESVGYVNVRVGSGSISELNEDDFFHNRRIVSLNDLRHLDADRRDS